MTLGNPKIILVFSGKRKCGKDFITDKILERLGEDTARLMRLAAPIKFKWAQEKGLNYERLLDNSDYKEQYRYEMVAWGESIRKQDLGYFCRATVEMFNAPNWPVWIITDCRRRTDLAYFKEVYGSLVKTVKVTATEEIRKNRGWVFTKGIDDAETECDMDPVNDYDFVIENNGTFEDIEVKFESILDLARKSVNQS